MGRGILRALLALLAATGFGAAVLGSAPAAAQATGSGVVAAACHASAGLADDAAVLLRDSARWDCRAGGYNRRAARTVLRFDLVPGQALPRFLASRSGTFDQILIAAIGRDGSVVHARRTMRDARPLAAGPTFVVALPPLKPSTRHVLIAFDGVWTAGIIADARLSPDLAAAGWPLASSLIAAAICGLLCTPLIFNLASWYVLRERFLLWHLVAIVGMIFQALVATGLILNFADVSLTTLVALVQMTVGVAALGGAMCAADLIERDKLPDATRRLLRASAWFSITMSALYTIKIEAFRTFGADLYLLSFLLLFALFVTAMVQAFRRQSRAVLFQIAAWIPIMVVSLVRMASNFGIGSHPSEAILAFTAAIGLEVAISALGVADRFLSIKRDRDRSHLRATDLADEAARDPLTGLLNRRAIEPHFAEMRRAGFHAMAVIDLDHFKAVNDVHGHAVGDRVLRAVADALQPDDDVMAVRLGGEEFVLLLRGRDALRRAEQRRGAIPARVAAAEPGLDRLVTASMGLVECPPELDADASFALFYARADRLLYEAKRAGRNRTVSERMNVFRSTPLPRTVERRAGNQLS